MLKYFLHFAVIFSVLALTSCIGIRSNKIPEVSILEIKSASSKKVKIFIDWQFSSGALNSEYNQSQKQKQILIGLINETRCCDVVSDRKEADLLLSGSIYNEVSPIALGFAMITGFSFYTIPSWANIKPQVLASVLKGDKIYNYDLSDEAYLGQWLPFIITMPFRENPITMENKLINNLYRNLLLQMKKDGLFKT